MPPKKPHYALTSHPGRFPSSARESSTARNERLLVARMDAAISDRCFKEELDRLSAETLDSSDAAQRQLPAVLVARLSEVYRDAANRQRAVRRETMRLVSTVPAPSSSAASQQTSQQNTPPSRSLARESSVASLSGQRTLSMRSIDSRGSSASVSLAGTVTLAPPVLLHTSSAALLSSGPSSPKSPTRSPKPYARSPMRVDLAGEDESRAMPVQIGCLAPDPSPEAATAASVSQQIEALWAASDCLVPFDALLSDLGGALYANEMGAHARGLQRRTGGDGIGSHELTPLEIDIAPGIAAAHGPSVDGPVARVAHLERQLTEKQAQLDFLAAKVNKRAEILANIRSTILKELFVLKARKIGPHEIPAFTFFNIIDVVENAQELEAATTVIKEEYERACRAQQQLLEALHSEHAAKRFELVKQHDAEVAALQQRLEEQAQIYEGEITTLKRERTIENELQSRDREVLANLCADLKKKLSESEHRRQRLSAIASHKGINPQSDRGSEWNGSFQMDGSFHGRMSTASLVFNRSSFARSGESSDVGSVSESERLVAASSPASPSGASTGTKSPRSAKGPSSSKGRGVKAPPAAGRKTGGKAGGGSGDGGLGGDAAQSIVSKGGSSDDLVELSATRPPTAEGGRGPGGGPVLPKPPNGGDRRPTAVPDALARRGTITPSQAGPPRWPPGGLSSSALELDASGSREMRPPSPPLLDLFNRHRGGGGGRPGSGRSTAPPLSRCSSSTDDLAIAVAGPEVVPQEDLAGNGAAVGAAMAELMAADHADTAHGQRLWFAALIRHAPAASAQDQPHDDEAAVRRLGGSWRRCHAAPLSGGLRVVVVSAPVGQVAAAEVDERVREVIQITAVHEASVVAVALHAPCPFSVAPDGAPTCDHHHGLAALAEHAMQLARSEARPCILACGTAPHFLGVATTDVGPAPACCVATDVNRTRRLALPPKGDHALTDEGLLTALDEALRSGGVRECLSATPHTMTPGSTLLHPQWFLDRRGGPVWVLASSGGAAPSPTVLRKCTDHGGVAAVTGAGVLLSVWGSCEDAARFASEMASLHPRGMHLRMAAHEPTTLLRHLWFDGIGCHVSHTLPDYQNLLRVAAVTNHASFADLLLGHSSADPPHHQLFSTALAAHCRQRAIPFLLTISPDGAARVVFSALNEGTVTVAFPRPPALRLLHLDVPASLCDLFVLTFTVSVGPGDVSAVLATEHALYQALAAGGCEGPEGMAALSTLPGGRCQYVLMAPSSDMLLRAAGALSAAAAHPLFFAGSLQQRVRLGPTDFVAREASDGSSAIPTVLCRPDIVSGDVLTLAAGVAPAKGTHVMVLHAASSSPDLSDRLRRWLPRSSLELLDEGQHWAVSVPCLVGSSEAAVAIPSLLPVHTTPFLTHAVVVGFVTPLVADVGWAHALTVLEACRAEAGVETLLTAHAAPTEAGAWVVVLAATLVDRTPPSVAALNHTVLVLKQALHARVAAVDYAPLFDPFVGADAEGASVGFCPDAVGACLTLALRAATRWEEGLHLYTDRAVAFAGGRGHRGATPHGLHALGTTVLFARPTRISRRVGLFATQPGPLDAPAPRSIAFLAQAAPPLCPALLQAVLFPEGSSGAAVTMMMLAVPPEGCGGSAMIPTSVLRHVHFLTAGTATHHDLGDAPFVILPFVAATRGAADAVVEAFMAAGCQRVLELPLPRVAAGLIQGCPESGYALLDAGRLWAQMTRLGPLPHAPPPAMALPGGAAVACAVVQVRLSEAPEAVRAALARSASEACTGLVPAYRGCVLAHASRPRGVGADCVVRIAAIFAEALDAVEWCGHALGAVGGLAVPEGCEALAGWSVPSSVGPTLPLIPRGPPCTAAVAPITAAWDYSTQSFSVDCTEALEALCRLECRDAVLTTAAFARSTSLQSEQLRVAPARWPPRTTPPPALKGASVVALVASVQGPRAVELSIATDAVVLTASAPPSALANNEALGGVMVTLVCDRTDLAALRGHLALALGVLCLGRIGPTRVAELEGLDDRRCALTVRIHSHSLEDALALLAGCGEFAPLTFVTAFADGTDTNSATITGDVSGSQGPQSTGFEAACHALVLAQWGAVHAVLPPAPVVVVVASAGRALPSPVCTLSLGGPSDCTISISAGQGEVVATAIARALQPRAWEAAPLQRIARFPLETPTCVVAAPASAAQGAMAALVAALRTRASCTADWWPLHVEGPSMDGLMLCALFLGGAPAAGAVADVWLVAAAAVQCGAAKPFPWLLIADAEPRIVSAQGPRPVVAPTAAMSQLCGALSAAIPTGAPSVSRVFVRANVPVSNPTAVLRKRTQDLATAADPKADPKAATVRPHTVGGYAIVEAALPHVPALSLVSATDPQALAVVSPNISTAVPQLMVRLVSKSASELSLLVTRAVCALTAFSSLRVVRVEVPTPTSAVLELGGQAAEGLREAVAAAVASSAGASGAVEDVPRDGWFGAALVEGHGDRWRWQLRPDKPVDTAVPVVAEACKVAALLTRSPQAAAQAWVRAAPAVAGRQCLSVVFADRSALPPGVNTALQTARAELEVLAAAAIANGAATPPPDPSQTAPAAAGPAAGQGVPTPDGGPIRRARPTVNNAACQASDACAHSWTQTGDGGNADVNEQQALTLQRHSVAVQCDLRGRADQIGSGREAGGLSSFALSPRIDDGGGIADVPDGPAQGPAERVATVPSEGFSLSGRARGRTATPSGPPRKVPNVLMHICTREPNGPPHAAAGATKPGAVSAATGHGEPVPQSWHLSPVAPHIPPHQYARAFIRPSTADRGSQPPKRTSL